MNKHTDVLALLGLCALLFPVVVQGQQAIQNPLIRPAWNAGSGGGAPAAVNAKSDQGSIPKQDSGAAASEELRTKAEGRITQEEFSIRQQALNASTVPAPLLALFDQMAVSAHVGGAVVLRRSEFSTPVLNTAPTVQPTGNQGATSRAAGIAPAVSIAQVTTSVLRLKLGRSTNLNGYIVRARLEDQEVTVEWMGNQGKWVTVFFGAIESAPNPVQVPLGEKLEKVDTEAFNYLVPKVSSRVISGGASGAGGFGAGGNGGGTNGGFNGGGQGFPSNGGGGGFGSAAPFN